MLWWLTVGSVRGFAFFLGLSTVLDVFVAWFFTRPSVILLSRSRVFTEMPVLGVARGLAAPDADGRRALATVRERRSERHARRARHEGRCHACTEVP